MSTYTLQKTTPETIAAIATARGMGGIGVVRISGSKALSIAQAIIPSSLQPRVAKYTPFLDGDNKIIDQGIALYFPSPHSFTGEEVVELQGHGGVVVLNLLLNRVCELGARRARPGEFSERAFLNGKIDLTQAEAIADLISSTSEQAARSAMRSLQGEFSRIVLKLVEDIIQLRIYIEASIDFPEEEIDFLAAPELLTRANSIMMALEKIKHSAEEGVLLQQGLSIVIMGKPNVGKSTLLNQLAQAPLAIVTDIAGTTRDLIKTQLLMDGIPLHVIDTAGIRTGADIIEAQGIARAWEEAEKADKILWVVDGTQENDFEQGSPDDVVLKNYPQKIIKIINKIDLIDKESMIIEDAICLSAKTGQGIDLLKQVIKKSMGFSSGEDAFMARKRHVEALGKAADYMKKALLQLQHKQGECVAEELRSVQTVLGEITGVVSTEDLLGRIFSSFCIGK